MKSVLANRIVFFIIGALLATISYLAGDIKISADGKAEFDSVKIRNHLFVDGSMTVDGGIFLEKKHEDGTSSVIFLQVDPIPTILIGSGVDVSNLTKEIGARIILNASEDKRSRIILTDKDGMETVDTH